MKKLFPKVKIQVYDRTQTSGLDPKIIQFFPKNESMNFSGNYFPLG
jgi:hypothetical protein